MECVRWLHLSDLHFGYDDFTVKEFRRQLATSLKEILGSTTLDYVFITGDLRYGKSKNLASIDYNDAVLFIKRICEEFGVLSTKIFVVPGNHDVDISLDSMRMLAIKNTKEAYNPYDGKIDITNSSFLYPSDDFIKAYKQITGTEFQNNHNLFKDNYLNVLCLDTSIVCTKSRDDYSALILGLDKVQSVLCNKDDKPLIVIAHHSLDWFDSTERILLGNLLMDFNATVYLCGHIHTDAATTLRAFSRPDKSLCQFFSPTSMDIDESNKHTTVMGFLIGKLDTENTDGEVTLYRWDMSVSKLYRRETLSFNGELLDKNNYQSKFLVEFLTDRLGVQHTDSSYILQEIQHDLFPAMQNELGFIYECSDDDVPLHCYLKQSWESKIFHHILLTGEGGIGKTVTLLQTCANLLKNRTPALYIQLHDLMDTGIDSYIEKQIFQGNASLINELMRLAKKDPTISLMHCYFSMDLMK